MSAKPLNQKGNVMLMLVVLILLVTILAASAYSLSSNQRQLFQRSTDYENAFHHAEQVFNEYLWIFNRDPSVLNNASLYQAEDYPAISPVKKVYTRLGTDPKFYLVSVEIPYLAGVSPPALATNCATVKVSAWPPDNPSVKRTIVAELVKRTFTTNTINCNSEKNKSNVPVRWDSGESFYGNFHTNSTLYLNGGPVFYGPVTYADNQGIDPWSKATDSSIFRKGAYHTEKIEWPQSNGKLLEEARIDPRSFYSKGRACIMLRGDEFDIRCWDEDAGTWRYNGYSYVYEPPNSSYLTNSYKDKGTFQVQKPPPNVFSSFKDMQANLPHLSLPDNRLIYIDGNTPASAYTNYHQKFAPDLGNVFVSGNVKGGLTIVASNDIFITGYDPTNWQNPWMNGDVPYFKSFEATGGIKYADTSYSLKPSAANWNFTEVSGSGKDLDVIGLIAQHDMYILHKSWPAQQEKLSGAALTCDIYGWGMKDLSGGALNDASPRDIEIQGNLLCVEGSFGFEKYSAILNYKGNFTLFGSLSQNSTGNLGDDNTIEHGYERRYIQDPRMKTMAPPHFLDPANSAWQVTNWAETDQHL